MTMPSEEVKALKCARTFIVQECIWATPWKMLWKIITGKFETWRKDAYYSVKHYPLDCKIDRLYINDVCPECGDDRQFCKCKKERLK